MKDKIILILCLLVLLVGIHYEAVYTTKGEVYSVNGNEVTFETNGHLFCCTTEEDSPNLRKGEVKWLKLTTEATESNMEDDHLINFGDYHFLCFVW